MRPHPLSENHPFFLWRAKSP